MHSEQRAANTTALIEEWRGQNRAVPLTVRAVSFEGWEGTSSLGFGLCAFCSVVKSTPGPRHL